MINNLTSQSALGQPLWKRLPALDQADPWIPCYRRGCWVRGTHCNDYKARGVSGNYEARGASGNYNARGASGKYEARGASGGEYEAQMVIFCILAAVN